MLPVGLTTDVSAGALAAGSAGLRQNGQATGNFGPGTEFEDELNALTENLAEGFDDAGDPDVSGGGAGASSTSMPKGEGVSPEGFPVGEWAPGEGYAVVVDEGGRRISMAGAEAGVQRQGGLNAPPQSEPLLPPDGEMMPRLQAGAGQADGSGAGLSGETADVQPAGGGVAAGDGAAISAYNISGMRGPGAAGKPMAETTPAEVKGSATGDAGAVGGFLGQLSAGEAVVYAAQADKSPADAVKAGTAVAGIDTLAGDKYASSSLSGDPLAVVERRWRLELPQELRAPTVHTGNSVQAGDKAGEQPLMQRVVSGKGPGVTNGPGAGTGAGAAVMPGLPEAAQAGTPPLSSVAEPFNQGAVSGANENSSLASGLSDAAALSEPGIVRKAAADVHQMSEARHIGKVTATSPTAIPEPTSDSKRVSEQPVAAIPTATDKHNGNDTSGPGNAAGAERPAARLAQHAGQPVLGPVPLETSLPALKQAVDLPASNNTSDWNFTGEIAASIRGGDLAGAMRTDSLQTPSQAQSGQVATQVAAEIARNLKNGQTKFHMRFDPPELGRVEVNMKVGADGSVQAHLIVERPETLDMFLRDQRGLERALETAGLSADPDNLAFSLKREGGQEFASGDEGADHSSEPLSERSGAGTEEQDLDSTDVMRLTLAEQRGGLDMKI